MSIKKVKELIDHTIRIRHSCKVEGRIVTVVAKEPRLDPQEMADALGAKPVSETRSFRGAFTLS